MYYFTLYETGARCTYKYRMTKKLISQNYITLAHKEKKCEFRGILTILRCFLKLSIQLSLSHTTVIHYISTLSIKTLPWSYGEL